MAFVVDRRADRIEVVVSRDRAVKCTKAEYERYLKSFAGGLGDETLLKLDGEPTRFVLRTDLSWQRKQKLRTKNIKLVGRKAEIDPNYSSELLRLHLVAIKNPAGVPDDKALKFSADADGAASRDLINMLDDAKVVADLVGALQAVRDADETEGAAQKNS